METIPAFYFDDQKLHDLAAAKQKEFVNATPFPHVVIDDFVDAEILGLISGEFPNPDKASWNIWGPGPTKKAHSKQVDKLGISAESQFKPFTRHFMHLLNSRSFIQFIEELTGEKGLIPDPSFNACGLHSTGPGGRLMLHVDHNRWPIKGQLHQRYNMILFLSRDWKEEFGGHLELWNRDASQCEKKILPVFNRMVLFDTGRFSYHGHPQPITCPPGHRRNSLAVYYYVYDRPKDENYEGLQSITWVPTTRTDKTWRYVKAMSGLAQRLTPPALWDLVKSVRGRGR